MTTQRIAPLPHGWLTWSTDELRRISASYYSAGQWAHYETVQAEVERREEDEG